MNRQQRHRLIMLMVPTLVWILTQIVMSGMGFDGRLGGAAMAANQAAPQIVICTPSGVHTLSSGPENRPAQTHHKCPWCAQNAGIGPVGVLVATLPLPKNIVLTSLWPAGHSLLPRHLTVANFQARAPPSSSFIA